MGEGKMCDKHNPRSARPPGADWYCTCTYVADHDGPHRCTCGFQWPTPIPTSGRKLMAVQPLPREADDRGTLKKGVAVGRGPAPKYPPAKPPTRGADKCMCGHGRSDHIYEEGACRPGFVCPDGCLTFTAPTPPIEPEAEPLTAIDRAIRDHLFATAIREEAELIKELAPSHYCESHWAGNHCTVCSAHKGTALRTAERFNAYVAAQSADIDRLTRERDEARGVAGGITAERWRERAIAAEQRIAGMQAERDRYREALEHIAIPLVHDAEAQTWIARAALGLDSEGSES